VASSLHQVFIKNLVHSLQRVPNAMHIVAGVDSVPNPIPVKAESKFKGVHIKFYKDVTIPEDVEEKVKEEK
jgi:hypothetical protein